MRSAAMILLLAALLPAGAALAHDQDVNIGPCDVREPILWGERHDPGRARLAVLTEDRTTALVLTRDLVAVQLSDRALHKLDRDIAREKEEEDGNLIAGVIKGAILGGVRAFLDHSLECPIEDLRDVRYRDGTLVLLANNGDHLLEDLTINGCKVLESLSERDALAFVREFRRVKQHGD